MENDAVRNRRVSSFPHRTNSSARPRSSCPKHSAMNHDGACLLLLLLPACRVGSWKALLELWPERDVCGARNVPAVERIWVSRACRWGWMFWRWVSYSRCLPTGHPAGLDFGGLVPAMPRALFERERRNLATGRPVTTLAADDELIIAELVVS